MGRYSKIKAISRLNSRGLSSASFYKNVKYPEIPLQQSDIYVYSEEGDRLDILASQYYGDSTLWWIISSANSFLKQDSYYLPLGVQIRIPLNIGQIQARYDDINSRN
jgi:hypothetical protein